MKLFTKWNSLINLGYLYTQPIHTTPLFNWDLFIYPSLMINYGSKQWNHAHYVFGCYAAPS